jgi:hypothetical protein
MYWQRCRRRFTVLHCLCYYFSSANLQICTPFSFLNSLHLPFFQVSATMKNFQTVWTCPRPAAADRRAFTTAAALKRPRCIGKIWPPLNGKKNIILSQLLGRSFELWWCELIELVMSRSSCDATNVMGSITHANCRCNFMSAMRLQCGQKSRMRFPANCTWNRTLNCKCNRPLRVTRAI